MKKKKIIKISSVHDKELESLIAEKDAEIKAIARKTGKILADRKLPNATGDQLLPHISEIKARYEKLCAIVYKRLQPAAHFPEVNTDVQSVGEHRKKAEDEIYHLNKQIENLNSELGEINVEGIYHSVRETKIKTTIIFLAEVFFNAMAFQVLGENLLFSFLIAIPVTLTIAEFSKLVALQYKKIQNKIKRRIFVAVSLLLVITLFFTLGYFRSQALGKEGFSLATLCFVIINLFIFLVSAFLHFKYSLTKEEKVRYHTYKKLKSEINNLEKLISENDTELNEKAVHALQLAHYTENLIEELKKSYKEAVEIMKSTNIMLRPDRRVPDCFSDAIPELETHYEFKIYKPLLQTEQ